MAAVFELIRDFSEVIPGIFELEIEEICVGYRPGTPDNLPLIGPSSIEGLTLATGHYRNGILLTPTTAELVTNTICGEVIPSWAVSCLPHRFAAAKT